MTSDSSGRVRLAGGSLIGFERHGDVLMFAAEYYAPCERPAKVADSIQLVRQTLRPVALPALLEGLCRHPWAVEDDLDLDHNDRTLRFSPNLECELGARLNGRPRPASYSLIHSTSQLDPSQSAMVALVQFNPNMSGSYTLVLTNLVLTEDTLLVNGRRYVKERAAAAEHRARGLGSRLRLFLDLAYDGELIAHRPTVLRLDFKAPAMGPSAHTSTLTKLRIAVRPRTREERGDLGKPNMPVTSRRYASRQIDPGMSFADTLTFVPPRSGELVALVLEWTFRDDDGEHRALATPVVRVR